MTAVETPVSDLERRIRRVRGPRPKLSRERSESLTPRQREILDDLTELVRDGFSHLTMADLAMHLNCSLRTLYGLAESRSELVLMATDRYLWNIGRAATKALTRQCKHSTACRGSGYARRMQSYRPLEAIRVYLLAANVAVSRTTPAFARDLNAIVGGPELFAAHNNYLVDVTRELLDVAVEQGEIAAVDTSVVARALAGLGRQFSEPEVVASLTVSPKDAADEVLDIILNGLPRGSATGRDASGAETRQENHAHL
ncbi:MAG: hypothetical protein OXB92_02640 [Acidimicrobiaceae bacterium]|nr:hypothetical protein [Acidimicrobiaceae bacterium]